MRLSIRARLFLTLLLACVVVLVGTQAFVQWSFQRGLVELADAREQERIERIAARLVEIYRRDRSWKGLETEPERWIYALTGRRPPPPPPDDDIDGRHFGHRPPWLRSALLNPGEWPPLPTLEQRRDREHATPLELRLMLLDAEGKVIYGRENLTSDARRYPLELDGEVIGELALLPGSPVPESAELRFRATQGDRLWIIAAAMLLLAAGLASPLSRRLIRPVRVFQGAARRLAAGDFTARVPASGSDEIGLLGRDINALAGALERNEQARRQWVADISHELRTPIALLRAELEALQDGIRPLDQSALEALHSDTMRLGRLVDDLYELTTTDLGALGYRLEPTDISELLEQDVEAFRTQFQETGLNLQIQNKLTAPVMLSADGQRLSQLFRNLMRNSLQYTDAGGGLTVRMTKGEKEIRIDFQDTAPGVPEDALAHLFERLYRVDTSRSRHSGGAGLGLAIAKNVVEAHGGKITAARAPAGGLWIRILLPL